LAVSYVVLAKVHEFLPPDVVGPFDEIGDALELARTIGGGAGVQWIYGTVGELLAAAAELEEEER
jgi:hypothetical protein